MRATATIRLAGGHTMEETVDVPDGADALKHWQGIIDRFNADLRGSEPRTLVQVIEEAADPVKHDWEKTNLVTIVKSGTSYDTVKCRRCGVTGKRYGIGRGETIDPKWKHERWQRCDTAVAHLVKTKKMAAPEQPTVSKMRRRPRPAKPAE